MPKNTYDATRKAEVVALAVVQGAEATAAATGIDARTIRRWLGRAGRAPADAISSASWEQLGDIARSRVAADLTSGKIKGREAAIVAGIAERNSRKPEPEPPQTEQEGIQAAVAKLNPSERRSLAAWCRAAIEYPQAAVECEWLLAEAAEHGLDIDWSLDLLIRRLDRCHQLEDPTTCGHDHDPEAELAWLLSLGDLKEYAERQREADREENDRRIDANRAASDAFRVRVMDEETAALIASAEAFLAGDAA